MPSSLELILSRALHLFLTEVRPLENANFLWKVFFPGVNAAISLSLHYTSGNILTCSEPSAVETLSARGLFENLKSTHACFLSPCHLFSPFYIMSELFTLPLIWKTKQMEKNRNCLTLVPIATTNARSAEYEPFSIIRNQRLIFLTQLLPWCNWEVGVGKQRWMYSFSTPPHHSIQWKCPCMCSRSWRICLSEFWGYALKEQAASRQSQRSWMRPLRLSVSKGLD